MYPPSGQWSARPTNHEPSHASGGRWEDACGQYNGGQRGDDGQTISGYFMSPAVGQSDIGFSSSVTVNTSSEHCEQWPLPPSCEPAFFISGNHPTILLLLLLSQWWAPSIIISTSHPTVAPVSHQCTDKTSTASPLSPYSVFLSLPRASRLSVPPTAAVGGVVTCAHCRWPRKSRVCHGGLLSVTTSSRSGPSAPQLPQAARRM